MNVFSVIEIVLILGAVYMIGKAEGKTELGEGKEKFKE